MLYFFPSTWRNNLEHVTSPDLLSIDESSDWKQIVFHVFKPWNRGFIDKLEGKRKFGKGSSQRIEARSSLSLLRCVYKGRDNLRL